MKIVRKKGAFMDKKKLYLAADSGGSKTVWLLINRSGDLIKSVKTNGLGAAPGTLPIRETVAKAYSELCDCEMPCEVFLSLGGPNTDEVREAIASFFGDIPITVEREASGNSILTAAKELGCSAVVMCGTGSVAVGDTECGRRYSGGWGPIYGDGGSGGGMGSEAMRIFLSSLDTNRDIGEFATLFSELTAGLDISSFGGRMELKRRALALSRRELAALAPEIYALALRGNETALKLYEKAASEISELALGVSDDSSDFSVLLLGGFFTDKPRLLDDCRRIFAEKSRAKLIYEPRFSPILAAQMSVLRSDGVMITPELFEKLLNN